jgi:predicted nucleotidyltransferase
MVVTGDPDEGFIPVVRRKKPKKTKTPRIKLDRDDVVETLRNTFSRCGFSSTLASSFLYGSTAKKLNTAASDLDIALVFNKKLPDREVLTNMKKSLESTYCRNVDLVCFVVCNMLVEEQDMRAQNFVENVQVEGVHLWGNDKSKSTDILQFSKLRWKVQ